MAPILADQADEAARVMAREDQVDPFDWASAAGRQGRRRTKPVITAINGKCFTAGIELALSTDIVIAEADVTFAQGEVRWGLMPLGGAVERFTTRFGWGNAMRWLLTGDAFDADEALRMGLVQEIVPKDKALPRAMEIADRIATAAPLGVLGTLENARLSLSDAPLAAAEHLRPFFLQHITPSADLQEGVASVFEKRQPHFTGR